MTDEKKNNSYFKNNKERCLELQKAFKEKNPTYFRDYYRNNIKGRPSPKV